MANIDKKIVMKMKVGSNVHTYFPKTTADNVYLTNGNTVQSTITSILSDVGVASSGSGNNAVAATGLHASVESLRSDLTALTTKVNTMYDKLCFESIYMLDGSGNVLTDASGTNLVAVY